MQEAQNLALDSQVFQKGAFIVVVAGILGAFLAGTMSDWVFKSRRPPVAFIGVEIQRPLFLDRTLYDAVEDAVREAGVVTSHVPYRIERVTK